MPIDLSGPTSGASDIQVAFGLVLMLVAIVLFAAVVSRLRFAGLSNDERRAAARIREQLSNMTMGTLTVLRRERDELERYRDDIADLAHATSTRDATVVDALGDVRATWSERTRPFPTLAMRVIREAVVLFAFASLVGASAEGVRRGLGIDALVPSLADVTATLSSAATATLDVAAWFPASNVVWALLLTLGIKLYAWLVANAIPIAGVLAAGGLAIILLDRQTDDRLQTTLYPSKRRLTGRVVGSLALIWLVGAATAQVGQAVGGNVSAVLFGGGVATVYYASRARNGTGVDTNRLGLAAAAGGAVALCVVALGPGGAGALFAFGLALVACWLGAVDVTMRLAGAYEALLSRDLPVPVERGRHISASKALVVGYLLIRKGIGALAVLMLPVVVWYGGQLVATGKAFRLFVAFLAAPLLTQAVVVLLGLVVLLVLVQLDRSAWTEVSQAISRAATRQAVRSFVFARALPLTVILVTVVLGTSYIGAVWVAVVVGVVLAVVTRLGYRLWQRASYRTHTRERPDRGSPSVVFAVGTIDDPNHDRTLYVGRVNGHDLAWPSLDGLVEQMLVVARAYFEGDRAPASLQHAYYEEMSSNGDTDVASVTGKRETEARLAFKREVRPDDIDVDAAADALQARFDPDVARRAREKARAEGSVARHGDRYYYQGSRSA